MVRCLEGVHASVGAVMYVRDDIAVGTHGRELSDGLDSTRVSVAILNQRPVWA